MKNEPTRGPGRPKNAEEKEAIIFLRTTNTRKGAYVASARKAGVTLAEWIFTTCDKASGLRKQPTPKGAK